MRMGKVSTLAASTAALALTVTPAAAEKASHLTSINGMSASSAENALQSRGFKYIESNTNSMGYTYSYWWDKEDNNCVRVEAYRGMVESIADASDRDCHHSSDGKTAAVVGVVAGAALLGALAAHKSNHHDDGQHYASHADEEQYDRGFTDGLYNATFHNYDRSDAYTKGYASGSAQRDANLSNRGRTGYGSDGKTWYQRLVGATNEGAEVQLGLQGYRNVGDYDPKGDGHGNRWYNRSTKMCLEVETRHGQVRAVESVKAKHCK